MSIETKTTRQVIDTALGTENWDLKAFYKVDKPEVKMDFEKPLWVPLVVAQKLEADFKLMETETLKQLHEKCRQIEAANKIIEETCEKECVDIVDVGAAYKYCTKDCELFRIKEVLIPRKENNEAKTP